MTTRLEDLSNAWPRDNAICPYCGKDIVVYRGCRTAPSAPAIVRNIHEIEPCVTCGSQECQVIEIKRQDALFNMLMRREAERQLLALNQETSSRKGEGGNPWRN